MIDTAQDQRASSPIDRNSDELRTSTLHLFDRSQPLGRTQRKSTDRDDAIITHHSLLRLIAALVYKHANADLRQ